MGDHYRQLSVEERVNIMLRLRDGMSSRAIVTELRRTPSTITREIGKHRRLGGCDQLPYEATRAAARAHMARFTHRRERKLDLSGELFAYYGPHWASASPPIRSPGDCVGSTRAAIVGM